MLYGSSKHAEYSSLLSVAHAELAIPHQSVPFVDPAVYVDKQSRIIKGLRARLDFYNIVQQGGKGLLVFAAALLLVGFSPLLQRD